MTDPQWDPFAKLPSLLSSDSWVPVEGCAGCSMFHLVTERQTSVVWTEYRSPLPPWYLTASWRPEFLEFLPSTRAGFPVEPVEHNPEIAANVELMHRIAPGDCVLWFYLHDASMNLFWQLIGAATPESSEQGGHLVRCMLRRNWPKKGQVSKIFLPGDGSEHRENEGCPSLSFVMEEGEDGTKLWQFNFLPWPEFPVWAKPHIENSVRFQQQWLSQHESMPMAAAAASFYVTLALRNCSRGLPLLPAGSGDITCGSVNWTAPAGSDFELAAYMNCLLDHCGVRTRAYASLDGQKLVPYQAVMQRSEWEAVKEELEGLMGLQRTAYRLLKGGTMAPKLREAKDTHFLEEFTRPLPVLMKAPGLTVKNTFVELGQEERKERRPVSRRAMECP